MKVYVVMSGEWEDEGINKVYLSEQKAHEYCKEINLLLPEDDPDRCRAITWKTDDDKPILKNKWAKVFSYYHETVDFIDYAGGPQDPSVDSDDNLTFTIDVSVCENYSDVMELAKETLEKLKESGELLGNK